MLPSTSPFADAAASAQPSATPPAVPTCSQRGSGDGRPTITALAPVAEDGVMAGGAHAVAVAPDPRVTQHQTPAPCSDPWVTGGGEPAEDPAHSSSLAGGPAAAAAEGVQAQQAGSMHLPGPAQMPHKPRRGPALPTILSEVSLVGLDEKGAWCACNASAQAPCIRGGGAPACTHAPACRMCASDGHTGRRCMVHGAGQS